MRLHTRLTELLPQVVCFVLRFYIPTQSVVLPTFLQQKVLGLAFSRTTLSPPLVVWAFSYLFIPFSPKLVVVVALLASYSMYLLVCIYVVCIVYTLSLVAFSLSIAYGVCFCSFCLLLIFISNDMRLFPYTYIIGHYNPSVRIMEQLLTPLMLCVLILEVTYSVESTPNDRFFKKLFRGSFIYSQRVFARNLLIGNRRRNIFFSYFVLMSDMEYEPGFYVY